MSNVEQLSPGWRYAAVGTFALGFAVLILLTRTAYEKAPPIPQRTVDGDGAVIFTRSDVCNRQDAFLKYGSMDNGTIWGHGAYLGPDFGATLLHDRALAHAQRQARVLYSMNYLALPEGERAVVDAEVARLLKTNRYDHRTGVLILLSTGAEMFQAEIERWRAYFRDPRENGGLPANLISLHGNFMTLRRSSPGRRGRP